MQLIDNHYEMQGVNLLDVVAEHGTPVYVYDSSKILDQISNLNEAFAGLKLKIKYATKALSNLSILKLMKKGGVGLDVVSIQELHLALAAGFTPTEIMFTPNCVPFEEIQEAAKIGVHINIDNLSFLETFGQLYGHDTACCIRINPHIAAGGNDKIKTGHAESKFGISILQIEEVYALIEKYNLNVSGLHVHTGSDFGSVDVFMQGAEVIFSIARNIKDLKFIDFGSGFKVAYKKGDKVTNMPELGAKMKIAFTEFCKSYGSDLEIWFEPGKYLVSESGMLLASATVLKPTPATTFVGVNTGLNHLIRPMMYEAYHHIVNVSNPVGELKNYSVVGYICETDTFGWEREMSTVAVGDVIGFKNAGAYGFSMSSNYNSRFRPAEVLIHNGKAQLIRRRETMEDILATHIDIEI
ncbi:MAG: diaminopimelate decarboxylase [Bacteroidota bacterium]|jgi:diaminopimelate decarboxylase